MGVLLPRLPSRQVVVWVGFLLSRRHGWIYEMGIRHGYDMDTTWVTLELGNRGEAGVEEDRG